MSSESTNSAPTDRLLIEIIDIAGEFGPEVQNWVRDEVARRLDGGDLGDVEAWLADADDTGPMGDGRNRVVLLHRPPGEVGVVQLAGEAPPWIATRHTYDTSLVSSRRAAGRPDVQSAKALRVVAMNCAEGSEDEFNAWYEEDHLPKFADVPGVLEARRVYSQHSARHHLALYWLDGLDVVHDPRWKAAADTEWTAAMRAKTFDRDKINFVPLHHHSPV